MTARAESGEAPDAPAVFAESEALDGALAASPPPEEVAERARRLVRHAAAAGAATWDREERDRLRSTISRWTTVLDRLGSPVELPDLARYTGGPPPLEALDAAGAIAAAHAQRPIVACRIEGEDLRGLDGISDVRIVDCVVSGCDLSGIRLPRARLLHTTFADCDLAGATLPGLVATSSIFKGGRLERIEAPEATFCGTRFDGTAMRGGDFTDASFASTTFRNGVDASEGTFVRSLFDLAVLETVTFDRAMLERTIFTGATLRGSTFHDADLRDAMFSSADLRDSDFQGARLHGAFFRTAVDVRRARFDSDAPDEAEFNPADETWVQAPGAAPEPA